jgi:hypothetical protein
MAAMDGTFVGGMVAERYSWLLAAEIIEHSQNETPMRRTTEKNEAQTGTSAKLRSPLRYCCGPCGSFLMSKHLMDAVEERRKSRMQIL